MLMRTLTAADFRIGLDNLLTTPERFSLFKQTAAYTVYGEELSGVRAELPLRLKGNRPLAKDLDVADGHHDDLGGALWHLGESIKRHPNVSAELKEKAERIQTHFVPSLSTLRAKYKEEVQAAKANRPKAIEMEAELKSVPTPDGRTAYHWVIEFLESGDKLGQLLDDRSKVEAGEPGPELLRVRTRALTAVTKARALVAEEAAKGTKLPKHAEAILFGYFDTLADFRSKTKDEDEEPPPPPAVPAPAEGPK